MTDREIVLAKYPGAVNVWTSRGWRIICSDGNVVGRTDSGHVPEDEAWENAADRIRASGTFHYYSHEQKATVEKQVS